MIDRRGRGWGADPGVLCLGTTTKCFGINLIIRSAGWGRAAPRPPAYEYASMFRPVTIDVTIYTRTAVRGL